MKTLIYCPLGKTGKFIAPASVRTIKDGAFSYEDCNLREVVFQEGLKEVEEPCSLYGPKIVTLPASVKTLEKEAFEGWHYMLSAFAIIRAPKNSYAHTFAVKKGFQFMPSDCNITWDSKNWLKRFNGENVNYRELRQEVWENTKAIVEANGYMLSDEKSVILLHSLASRKKSSFYHRAFTASFEPLTTPTEIIVVSDDCLDMAHQWVNEGLEVCVLNMASRRNLGGSVTKGAGAQEEYLFRCSDYYKFLYRYVSYAGEYGVTRSHYQYPLDQNFGGIYSPDVCIFRENEKSGYQLADAPWKVNMVAVAGMNSPELIWENGKERIAPELIEGVKNKVRTIFRIACTHCQKNLVLGALGCGAFGNPPEHIAEIFRDVLCEKEFEGAFRRICFAVKTDHNSGGSRNYEAFKKILRGFVPNVNLNHETHQILRLSVKKIVIASDCYAVLDDKGNVFVTDTYSGESWPSHLLRGSIDIAAGFHHIIGLTEYGSVNFQAVGSQAPSSWETSLWYGGIAVAASEGHSAMLKEDGTVCCVDYYGIDTRDYEQFVESLYNIKQIALTFEEPFALTKGGEFVCRSSSTSKLFNNGGRIVQIEAFGAYYCKMTVATLYANGTVRAFCGFPHDYDIISEVETWRDVKKICCGMNGSVIGLTNAGRILLPQNNNYKDRENNQVIEINDVLDIVANFEHFIALTRTGKIIYYRQDYLS